jgi:hypothetical protein
MDVIKSSSQSGGVVGLRTKKMMMLVISSSVHFQPAMITEDAPREQHDGIDCTHHERVHFICQVECDPEVAPLGGEAAIVCCQSNGDSRNANDKGEYAHANGCEPKRHDERRRRKSR